MDRVYDALEAKQAQRESRKAAESLAKQEAGSASAGPSLATVTATVSQPPKKKQKKKSLLQRMAGEVTDLTQPAANLKKEVSEYQGAMVRADVGPLEWWARHAYAFQNVAELAREYLSIPPTEVSVSGLSCLSNQY